MKDIHKEKAHEIFGIPVDKVYEEQRRVAKTINFGIIYGCGKSNIAEIIRSQNENDNDNDNQST